MAAASPIDLLDRALAQSTQLVSAVTPDQLDSQTPCTEWVVRDLLRHMVGGLRNFRAVVAGEPMQSFDVVVHDDVLAADFRWGPTALIAAWREEGVLERTMTMFGGAMPAMFPLSLQVTEEALHSWDLATAIGQADVLDDEVAEFALAFAQKNMGAERRGTSFGPPLEAADGAAAYQRLAAFAGRQVLPTPDRAHLQTTEESSARAGAQGLVGDRDNGQASSRQTLVEELCQRPGPIGRVRQHGVGRSRPAVVHATE